VWLAAAAVIAAIVAGTMVRGRRRRDIA
jgi:hypothetical protein